LLSSSDVYLYQILTVALFCLSRHKENLHVCLYDHVYACINAINRKELTVFFEITLSALTLLDRH